MKTTVIEIIEKKPKFKPFELRIQIDEPIELMELWLLLNTAKADLYEDAGEFFITELLGEFVNTTSTSTQLWREIEKKCVEFEMLKTSTNKKDKKGKKP